MSYARATFRRRRIRLKRRLMVVLRLVTAVHQCNGSASTDRKLRAKETAEKKCPTINWSKYTSPSFADN